MNKIIYILALGVFGVITTEFGVIGILPALAEVFNVSIDVAGWLLSGFALTVALSGPFATVLTGNINRKTMLLFVLITFILSNILSAISPNFTVLMISRIIPAFFYPVFWAIALTVAAKQVAPKDAPKAVAVVMTGLSIATVLGVPITTYFASIFTWKASFLIAGFINLIALTALIIFVPSMPVKKENSVVHHVKILKHPHIWLNYSYVLLMIAGMFSTYSFLAEYFSKITKMNGTEVSIMLLLFGSAGIIGNWVMGKVVGKSVANAIRFFPVVLILVELLAYFFGALFTPMIIIILIWGFVHTGGFLIGNTRGSLGVPSESLEFVNSLLPSFFNFGIMFGTMIGGYTIKHFGTHNVIWVSIFLLLFTFILSLIPHKKVVTDTNGLKQTA